MQHAVEAFSRYCCLTLPVYSFSDYACIRNCQCLRLRVLVMFQALESAEVVDLLLNAVGQ